MLLASLLQEYDAVKDDELVMNPALVQLEEAADARLPRPIPYSTPIERRSYEISVLEGSGRLHNGRD